MRVKTVNISLPEELLGAIDRKAKEEYRSRSELVKEASLMYIQSKDNWQVLQSDIARKAKKIGLKTEGQVEQVIDSLRR